MVALKGSSVMTVWRRSWNRSRADRQRPAARARPCPTSASASWLRSVPTDSARTLRVSAESRGCRNSLSWQVGWVLLLSVAVFADCPADRELAPMFVSLQSAARFAQLCQASRSDPLCVRASCERPHPAPATNAARGTLGLHLSARSQPFVEFETAAVEYCPLQRGLATR